MRGASEMDTERSSIKKKSELYVLSYNFVKYTSMYIYSFKS